MTQQEINIKKMIPRYEGTLRKHILRVPEVIRECSGIVIFGRRIKSVAFTTDLCIVRNMDADAVLAVYPFTPQPIIIQALLLAADIPVFAGVGGGLTHWQAGNHAGRLRGGTRRHRGGDERAHQQ